MTDNSALRQPKLKRSQSRGRLFCKGKMDLVFLFLVLGILATGLVMLFSASSPYASTYYGNSYYFIIRQSEFAVLGLIAMYVASKFDYHFYKKFAWAACILAILLLLLVLVTPEVTEGFKRWLKIGPFTFQPSEFAKFALILILSYLISKRFDEMNKPSFDIKMLGIVAVFAVLVIAEKHISATILILAIGYIVIFAGGMNKKLAVWLIVGVTVAALVVGFISMQNVDALGYVSKLVNERCNIWLNLWDYDRDLTHQSRQSLMAIGSGGILGQGIGQSTQKYLWVPEPQNDFIFSIVCEELGLFGALLIILAFALLVWRGFVISMHAPDKFGALLSLGISVQVGLQVLLNLLVVTNSMPNTGISLPFFSYGGSSLLMLLAEMGIVLGISRQSRLEKL